LVSACLEFPLLQRIDITCRALVDDGASLARLAREHTGLDTLCLNLLDEHTLEYSCGSYHPHALDPLIEAISTRRFNPSLQHLSLAGTQLTPGQAEDLARGIAAMVRGSTDEDLDCATYDAGSRSRRDVSGPGSLSARPTARGRGRGILLSLDLDDCLSKEMYPEAVGAIVAALEDTQVERFRMCGAVVSHAVMHSLFRLVQSAPWQLKELGLARLKYQPDMRDSRGDELMGVVLDHRVGITTVRRACYEHLQETVSDDVAHDYVSPAAVCKMADAPTDYAPWEQLEVQEDGDCEPVFHLVRMGWDDDYDDDDDEDDNGDIGGPRDQDYGGGGRTGSRSRGGRNRSGRHKPSEDHIARIQALGLHYEIPPHHEHMDPKQVMEGQALISENRHLRDPYFPTE